MTQIAETERLILRLPIAEDAADSFEIYGDPEVMRFVDDSKPFESVDVAAESISRGLEHFDRHGVCHWAVVLKSSAKLIGHCGFNIYEGGPDLELVFHFNRKHWGKGYASEAARACVDYALSNFPDRRIVALTFPNNTASIRVLEKLGMLFVRDVKLEGDVLRLYEKTSGHS